MAAGRTMKPRSGRTAASALGAPALLLDAVVADVSVVGDVDVVDDGVVVVVVVLDGVVAVVVVVVVVVGGWPGHRDPAVVPAPIRGAPNQTQMPTTTIDITHSDARESGSRRSDMTLPTLRAMTRSPTAGTTRADDGTDRWAPCTARCLLTSFRYGPRHADSCRGDRTAHGSRRAVRGRDRAGGRHSDAGLQGSVPLAARGGGHRGRPRRQDVHRPRRPTRVVHQLQPVRQRR